MLTVTKIGDEITYSFKLENLGNVTLHNLTVTDPMFASIPVVAALAPHASTTVTAMHTVTQADLDRGHIDNTASAAGSRTGSAEPVQSNESSATVQVVATPSLSITKSSNATATTGVDDTITYTFNVKNTGNVSLTNVAVTDLMSGLGAISPSSIATLAPNEIATFTATYVVLQSDVDAGLIHNSASASGTPITGGDPVTSSPSTLDVRLAQTTSLLLVKRADAGANPGKGSAITYTFTVKNTGNTTLTDVFIADTLPGISAIAPLAVPSLAPQASVDFIATYLVKQTDVNAGSVVNHATAHSTFGSNSIVSNEDSATVLLTGTDKLILTKVADTAGPIVANQVVTYTYKVHNQGTRSVQNVAITDPMSGLNPITPATVLNLDPGEDAIFTATYTVTQNDIDLGSISNTAIANGVSNGNPVQSNQDSVTLSADRQPSLLITKSADVLLDVVPGDTITYTFKVKNTGNVTLDGVVVIDHHTGLTAISPASIPSLAPGGTVTFTASYVVTENDIAVGSIINQAIATGLPHGGGEEVDSDPSAVTVLTMPCPTTGMTSLDQAFVSIMTAHNLPANLAFVGISGSRDSTTVRFQDAGTPNDTATNTPLAKTLWFRPIPQRTHRPKRSQSRRPTQARLCRRTPSRSRQAIRRPVPRRLLRSRPQPAPQRLQPRRRHLRRRPRARKQAI